MKMQGVQIFLLKHSMYNQNDTVSAYFKEEEKFICDIIKQ